MVYIKITNLEHGIHEALVANHDGTYTVFLNAKDSHERRMESYKHAIRHLERRDFEKSDVQKIETENH